MKWMVPAVVAALAPSAMANGEDAKFHLEKNNMQKNYRIQEKKLHHS